MVTGATQDENRPASGVNTQDQAGGTSAGATEEVVSIPKKDYEKLQSDYKSMVGRMKTVTQIQSENTELKGQVEANTRAMGELQRQLEAAEDAKIGALPADAQAMAKETRRLRAEMATLRGENDSLKKTSGRLQVLERKAKAIEIEVEMGLPMNTLAEYADLPEERLRALGERLKAVKPAAAEGEVQGMIGDSLVGRGAPTLKDDDFLKAYAAGESNDHKRAQKIQRERGIKV